MQILGLRCFLPLLDLQVGIPLSLNLVGLGGGWGHKKQPPPEVGY
jgi:hypothetical protein